AYRLQQQGYSVQVYEASDSIGGLAATYETAGDHIEKFYHHLSKSEQTIVELANELGLGDKVEWNYKSDGYYVNGVVHPLDKPWEILAYPHLSLYDKFRLGMLTLDIDVRGGIPKFDTYENLEDFENVPVKEFILEHTTQSVYTNFFEPLLDAKFGSRKDDVSAAWLLGRIKFRGERDFLRGEILGYIKGGFHLLIEELINAIGRENITTNATVTDITITNGAVSEIQVADGNTTVTHSVSDVIVATMPHVLESLTGYTCSIDFQGTICSVISTEESLMDTYWLNIADKSRFGVLIEHTNFIPKHRYGDEHLLYAASYIQDSEDKLWQMSNEEIERYWIQGIENMFPDFKKENINWVKTARNPRTAPIYEQGYLQMVIPYDLGDDVAENLYYAGMASRAQYPERSLNGGIKAGYACADRIIEK
ncbi:MAG: NAD(P)/FAD-dependent oxidoreductase, partial [Halobacteriaceae archaeon]